MHVEFEFSGGYGGLFATEPLTYRAELEELPEETRSRLSELIRSSGLLESEPPAVREGTGQARDTFTYRLSIREKNSIRRFCVDDVSAPPGVHPLLDFLRDLALESRMSEA